MKKVLKRLFVVFCLVASMLLVAPFHITNADTSVTITTDNIVGLFMVETNDDSGTTLAMILDNEYIGTILLKVNVQYFNGTNTATVNANFNFRFNGSIGYATTNVPLVTTINSYTITSQSLSLKNDTSLVYNIDYRDIVGYNYWQLYNMVTSNSTVAPSLYASNFKTISSYVGGASNPFIRMIEEPLYIAVFSNKNNTDVSVVPYYSPNSQCTVTVTRIIRDIYTDYAIGSLGFSLLEIKCNKPYNSYQFNTTNDRYILNWSNMAGQEVTLIPIYYGTRSAMSDEMIRFLGLDESVQSATDLENEQSEFGQSADELYTYENDFNDSLNDSLDDINVNFDIGNTFGSKFLASASWVRQQFDALTSSSPFGSVLSFSLVLGIALLVIGKAVK